MIEAVKYNATAKWLHWVVAVMAVIMLVGGRTLESLPLDERAQIIMVHSGLGTLVLLLMVLRLIWRQRHPPPAQVSTMSDLQVRLSLWMHRALYALFILQALLGIGQAMFITDYEVAAFGVLDYSAMAADNAGVARVFHILHGLNSVLLSVLVLGHIGAAFYHHFWQKDDVLRRMLPFGKVRDRQ